MIDQTFWGTILAATLACVVTSIGIYAIHTFSKWGKRNIVYFISFAAGVLISVSFLHIVPRSFALSQHAPIYLLAGFGLLFLINRYLSVFVCTKPELKYLRFGAVLALGIGFHSFIDGIIYSVAFNVSMLTGVLAAVGMVLHEFPEGIVTFLVFVKAGLSKSRAALYAFLSAAITTPAGALVSYPIVSTLTTQVLGNLLSMSAGALIYVGASHLLPETEKAPKVQSLLAFGAGILVAILIILSK